MSLEDLESVPCEDAKGHVSPSRLQAVMHTRLYLSVAAIHCLSAPLYAEWPQWRGPGRGGVSADTTPIAEVFPEAGLTKVWESGFIPSDHYGGHGSPVVAGERVFLSVVWHERVPSETREIDTEVMQQLNHRGTSPELREKMEAARLSMSSRLRGERLDEWAKQWVKDNMTEKEQVSLASWALSRFRAGKTAFPLDELDKVSKRQGKPFANIEEFKSWMEAEALGEALKEKLLSAVPNTIKVAKDVLVCLDLNTGKELWKYEAVGKPTGRNSSSTAAVMDGRVFFVGSTQLYAVNAEDGKLHWQAELPAHGAAASPLVENGMVYMAAGHAQAFAAKDGKLLWEQKSAKGNTGSPAWWKPTSGAPVVIINGSANLSGLDPETGEVKWTVEGGGQSTPVTEGDWLVIYSGSKDVGLRAYQYQNDAAPKAVWSHFWVTMRYSGSPIIYDDHVYLTCGGKHQCVELATGKITWLENEVNSTITSPILADGKVLVYENNGSHLRVMRARADQYESLARLRLDGMGCTSPALSNGRLIVRQKEKLACFDLRPQP